MRTTPQERLALGVIATLLVAGAAVRHLQRPPEPEWSGPAAERIASAAALGNEVEQELARARRRALPLAPGERIDVNTADGDELQRLPRVGPALATRIVDHRAAHGAFRSLADLGAVPGIGPSTLDGIAPFVELPPGPPPGSAGQARLDLNAATADELRRLPGIGPVLAERIVAWRDEHGRFRSVEELRAVPGIGAQAMERLAPLVRAAQ